MDLPSRLLGPLPPSMNYCLADSPPIKNEGAFMTTFKNVTVLGTGVLGSQIAYQSAFRGFQVTVWDIDDTALAGAKERFAQLAAAYTAEVELPSPDAPQAAIGRI